MCMPHFLVVELLSSSVASARESVSDARREVQIVTFSLGLRFTSLANTSGCEADRKGVYHRVVAQIEFTT